MLGLNDALTWRATRFGAALISSFSLLAGTAVADVPLDPALIIELRQSHLRTCAPTVIEQLRSIGYAGREAAAQEYCACVGIMYFNDFTRSDFSEMQRSPVGRLPKRIEANQKAIQEYCASIHLSGI